MSQDVANLSNKVAIVTGASSGIGRATADSLAAAGASVILSARRHERLEEVAAGIQARGGAALVVPTDVGDPAEVDRLWDQSLAWRGQVDIVIVNAGRGLAGGLLSSDRAQWESLYQVNVLGAAHLLRRAAEHMVSRQTGDIVALGSVAGHNISPFSGFYGSSKWALAGMTEGLRREVCGKKVRVTIIKPAVVVSEFQDVAGYTYENFGKGAQRFGPLLEPQDVARTITFVVSQPPHVHLSELVIRPTGQDYP